MRKKDGLLVASPRDPLLDGDILYRHLFCWDCGTIERHIYCDLLTYSGLGYACLKCETEQVPMRPYINRKRESA